MKVIISHDVDHIRPREHWFRDLFFSKLWYRETANLIKRRISILEWTFRCTSFLSKRLNNIPEVIDVDNCSGIPSTFFFGMNQGLNMSYKPQEAKAMIEYVKNHGFSVGVHGISYNDENGIKNERESFEKVTGFEANGIRMHYVRNDENTIPLLEKAGYQFDSSEFDKKKGYTIKNPYKVGEIWEFPVGIMDSYLDSNLETMKSQTLEYIDLANKEGIEYLTILFHDFYYSKAYENYMKWYEWLIAILQEDERYSFISFEDAIREMEKAK